ncbi:cytochrome c peroxidase [Azoarcus sp. DN11]|uniref:cytochrome-c peroxidase n=1 Tax=Azoarcus sp. DN11 TaxID=356837 RepID=UPI000EAD376E|nr:cytochrome c peroxidase [Azoarcus sp. DN11]AYH44100.1 hypothetical protein CDA09_12010 [Azoarcus sp. DN11]
MKKQKSSLPVYPVCATLLSVTCLLAAGLGQPAIAQTAIAPDPAQLRVLALKTTNSLKTVGVPNPGNLKDFVVNRGTLIKLGKALFWDQQVGSDGQACGSCHFHAGADNRSLHQLNPGFRNQTPGADPNAFRDATFFGPNLTTFGPNYQLKPDDFPFHKLVNVNDRESGVLSDTNDVVSSQGVFNATFGAIGASNAAIFSRDSGTTNLVGPGAVFQIGGRLVRNVEPRNTPTNINAVLNDRNFWDSRARNEFNGVNPIGALDRTAMVVQVSPGGPPSLVAVRIANSSAASQADGPPLSNLEMSFAGRRFPELGRKMLNPDLVALGSQFVAKDDSILGADSNQNTIPGSRGIKPKYAVLIQKAFSPQWWNAPGWFVDLGTGTPVLRQGTPSRPNQFSVMEYNFSLFFGMAVNDYERLLISDGSPFDQFMEGVGTITPAPLPLSDAQLRGLQTFLTKGGCINCHSGPELTNASLSNVLKFEILERMIMGNGGVAVYDNGHYNVGVRPTLEDVGIGATIGPDNLPLSNTVFFQNCVRKVMGDVPGISVAAANQQCGVPQIVARPAEAAVLLTRAVQLTEDAAIRAGAEARIASAEALLTQAVPDLVGASCKLARNPILCPTDQPGAADLLATVNLPPQALTDLLAAAASLLPDPVSPGTSARLFAPPLGPDERVAVMGAHKVPSLRNVELTAPYFHNGGQATLHQVVEFYNRGGDFSAVNQDDLDPNIHPLGLTDEEKDDLVAFLTSLTDDRVRYERAPFDRPSISIPNGAPADVAAAICLFTQDACAVEARVEIPAVGATGHVQALGTPHTPYANFLDPLTP